MLAGLEKNSAISGALDQLRGLAGNYGINFKNTETLSDVFYNFAMQKLNLIPDTFRNLIPVGLVLLIFLTIKGVAVFLRWFISGLAYLLYELALATGFARLTLESRSREIVVLK